MPLFTMVVLSIAVLILIVVIFKKEKEKIELFHMMAHKLRSHISTIKWYTELLSDKSVGTLNDKQKEYFNEIRKASQKFNEIIDSISQKRLQK